MDTTLLNLAQIIMAAMPEDHSFFRLAKMISELVQKVSQDPLSKPKPGEREVRDWDEVDEFIGKRLLEAQSEGTADAAAWHLMHFLHQIRLRGKRDLPFLAPWLLAEVHAILQTSVQWVPSNQRRVSHRRFYTEDIAVPPGISEHHLIDLCTYDGKNYLHLIIRQFRENNEGNSAVLLSHNEVEELLTVLLQQRFQEIEAKHKREMEDQDDNEDDDEDADEDDKLA